MEPIRENKLTLTEQVRIQIRRAIFEQALPAGEKIDQVQLAEQLNVSLVPVREALKLLASEGLVSLIPRRGAYVVKLSQEHLIYLYETRQLIEGGATEKAVPLLTDEHFNKMNGLMEDMQSFMYKKEPHKAIDLNQDFHMTIYEALENPMLTDIIKNLREQSKIYIYRYLMGTVDIEEIHQEHQQIAVACQAYNVDLAKQLTIEHIQKVQVTLLEKVVSEQA